MSQSNIHTIHDSPSLTSTSTNSKIKPRIGTVLDKLKEFRSMSLEEQAELLDENVELASMFTELTMNKKTKKEKQSKKIDPDAQRMAEWYYSLKDRNNKS